MTTPIPNPSTTRVRAPRAWVEVDTYLRFTIPDGPGCYAICIAGRVVYVGQTLNLRNRLRSYQIRPTYGTGHFTPWGQFDNVVVKVKPGHRYGDWAMRELRLLRRLKPEHNRMCVARAV